MRRVTLASMFFVPFIIHCGTPEEPIPIADEPAPIEEAQEETCQCPMREQAEEPGAKRAEIHARLSSADRTLIEASDAPAVGVTDAPVTVVLFADYACSFAPQLAADLDTVMREHGSMRLIYRQRPLPFHKHARMAAVAALAAAEQDRLSEYQTLLYAHQDAQDHASLLSYARTAGLDIDAFTQALNDRALHDRVDADVALAKRLGVRASPTMFINGAEVRGAWPIDELRRLVDEAEAE